MQRAECLTHSLAWMAKTIGLSRRASAARRRRTKLFRADPARPGRALMRTGRA